MELDATLHRLARNPHAEVDLFEVGLQLAADEYPQLNLTEYLLRVQTLADKLEPRLQRRPLKTQVEILAEYLFDDEGFAGNDSTYYDPRNSFLSDVLDRRLGIPITLSIVAAAVGARAGMDVVGVALPGHFVAMARNEGDSVVFDPFHKGRVLDAGGCEALVHAITGKYVDFDPRTIAPAAPGQVLQRMLNNLKAIYLRAGDFTRGARTMTRLVQLNPTDPIEQRDLGVTLCHAGQQGRAVAYLEMYLREIPDAEDQEAVKEFLKKARKDVARWN